MSRWTRIVVAAMAAVVLVAGSAGADERKIVLAVEKLILEQQNLGHENQALSKRVRALEAKVKTLEEEAKEPRSPVSSTSSGDRGVFAKLKRFFVGDRAAREQNQEQAKEQKVAPATVEVVRPLVPAVDPAKLPQQEKPKDCTPAEENGVKQPDTTGGCPG